MKAFQLLILAGAFFLTIGSLTAQEIDYGGVAMIRSIDGRDAQFKIISANGEGLFVARVFDNKGFRLKWEDIDVDYFSRTQNKIILPLAKIYPQIGRLAQRPAAVPRASAVEAVESVLSKGSINLFVRPQSEVSNQDFSYHPAWGSYVVDNSGSRKIYIKARRTAGPSDMPPLLVDVIFLTGYAPKYTVVSRRQRRIDFPLATDVVMIPDGSYANHAVDLKLIDYQSFDGTAKITAWAVRILDGDCIVASQASLPETADWVEKILPGIQLNVVSQ